MQNHPAYSKNQHHPHIIHMMGGADFLLYKNYYGEVSYPAKKSSSILLSDKIGKTQISRKV